VADLEWLDRYHVNLLAIKPAAEKSAPFVPATDYLLAQDDVLVVMGEETKLIELHQKLK
jgi:K+/H+ antiporter YhaU regulatory subunit KhtT